MIADPIVDRLLVFSRQNCLSAVLMSPKVTRARTHLIGHGFGLPKARCNGAKTRLTRLPEMPDSVAAQAQKSSDGHDDYKLNESLYVRTVVVVLG